MFSNSWTLMFMNGISGSWNVLQQFLNLVTVSVIYLAGWQTINLGRMPTKQISSLQVHPKNAANLLISSLRSSLVIASHHQTLYVIVVLHLIAIVSSENIFLWHVAPVSIILSYSSLYLSVIRQNHGYSTHYL